MEFFWSASGVGLLDETSMFMLRPRNESIDEWNDFDDQMLRDSPVSWSSQLQTVGSGPCRVLFLVRGDCMVLYVCDLPSFVPKLNDN